MRDDCSGINIGYSYCIEVNFGNPRPTTAEPTPTGAPKPSPTQPGIIDTCTQFHKAVSGDNCADVVAKYGISMGQFMEWNEAVSESCAGFWLDYYYCVAIPGMEPPATTTAEVPAGPTPTQDGIIETCDKYHKAVAGDNCADVAATYGISLAEFLKWNTAVSAGCSGFWLGYYYCVGIPETQPPVTPTTTTAPSGPTPTQAGIIKSCQQYHKAESGDLCAGVVTKYGITMDDFLEWNQAVSADCSGFWMGYYYCVGIPGTKPPVPTPTTTSAPPAGPTPTQDGIISTCARYHKSVAGDTCASIVDKYGTFSLTQFISWNKAVKADCSGLWLGYYYCVGIPGTPTEPPVEPTPDPTGCTNPNLPTPTQPGAFCDCTKWHKVGGGDTCETIINRYNMLTSLFHFLNPQVGEDCKTLWGGYNVCVGV